KEMALGVYYLTSEDPRIEASDKVFSDQSEAVFTYQSRYIELRQRITVRIAGALVETTVGRILFNEVLPDTFDFVNEGVTSSIIKKLFGKAYATMPKGEVVLMIDAIK